MPSRIWFLGSVLLLAGLCASVSFGASPSSSAYQRASDNLALGFDKLRWGMTSEEVRRAYPALNFTMDYSGLTAAELASAWGPPQLVAGDYSYAGCSFRVVFSFYHARLYHVRGVGENARVPQCREEIDRGLLAQYGPPDLWSSGWRGLVTQAYRGYSTSFEFWDENDISGRLADSPHNMMCHSITVEFPSEPNVDGASNPLIAPHLQDLNCEYPTTSVRLQEQGAVVLNVRVLADGSVGSAEIAKPA